MSYIHIMFLIHRQYLRVLQNKIKIVYLNFHMKYLQFLLTH